MDAQIRTISFLIGLGSLLFLVAAFLPISRVYVESSADKKLKIILNGKGLWNISQILFAIGSVVTAAGIVLVMYQLNHAPSTGIMLLITIFLLTGTLSWSWHVIERIISPESFAYSRNTPYFFLFYSVLTQAGLLMFGLFLLRTPIPGWIGWMFVISMALFFVLMIIFRDMPPFLYYLPSLIFAITLFTGNS